MKFDIVGSFRYLAWLLLSLFLERKDVIIL